MKNNNLPIGLFDSGVGGLTVLAAVRAHLPGAIIIRPSLVFGPEDDFTNRFANMARFMPFLPLIGGGDNHIQPVYAGDVAEAIVAALDARPSDAALASAMRAWDAASPIEGHRA